MDQVIQSQIHLIAQCRLALILPLVEGKSEKAYEVIGGPHQGDGEWMYTLAQKVTSLSCFMDVYAGSEGNLSVSLYG